MLEKICEEINKGLEGTDLYIGWVKESKGKYYVQITDANGDPGDGSFPYVYDAKTGKETVSDYDNDYDIEGSYCKVPGNRKSNRDLVMEKLEATVPYDVIDNCGEWGLNIPVNMFFSDGFAIDGMTLPQMYAVCRRLIDTMAILCSDEEKADCMAFMNNKYIWEILCDPKEGLESTTLEYYYYPKYFEELLIESEGMKRLAQGKRAGNAVDENECDLIKDKLNKKADQVRELICKESDIFCDKEVLVGRFIKLLTCIEQEYFYCKGVSEVLSDRADPDKNTFAEGGIEDLEEDMDPFTECFEFIGGE